MCSLTFHNLRSRLTDQKLSVRNSRSPKASFSQILKSSIERETTSRGWCSRCQRYQSLATRKTIHSVPAVLMLNTAIASLDAKQFWATPGWLPEEIGVIIDQGQFFCYQGEDLKLHLQRGIHNITVYSLIGLCADIDSGQHQKSHLVSLVNGMLQPPTACAHFNLPQWPIVYLPHLQKASGTYSMTSWFGQLSPKKH